jgi:protocatechuate 3,4-dioxygenase, alpha subunit
MILQDLSSSSGANVPTASQTVGPFFSIGLKQHCRSEMLPADGGAARSTIQGRVLDGDGMPVPDAVLEIWYPVFLAAGSELNSHASGFPNGFVRVATDEQGQFQFSVLKPVGLKDLDGNVDAPHFAVLLFMRGLLRHLVTRLYFPNEASNARDAVLQLVPTERRETLVAKSASGDASQLLWDIHLQGELETVFFEA